MPQLLSVSRAARLAGVARAELQGRIRRGELETFEGQIDVRDLLRLYPQVSLEQDETLERVDRIKARSTPKRSYADGALPDPEVLFSRFNEVSRVLVETKSGLNRAERLIGETLEALEGARDQDEPALRRSVGRLVERLRAAQAEQAAAPDPRARVFSEDRMLRLLEAHVRIVATGHDFFVRGRESILEAAIRAGLYLSYGCLHGNCGKCKCRVVSGEARRLRDHEYVLGEQERADGHILACSYTAVTDLDLDATEALSVGDIPDQEIRGAVKQLRPLSEGLVLLQVRTPATHTFRFMSGQHADLTLENGARATLPVASCPCSSRQLDFILRAASQDPFSRALLTEVKPGQLVTLRGPSGGCTLQVDAPEPAVFVAVDDGIAPVRSMIEHAIAIDLIERLTLVWAVPGERSPWLDGVCRAWNDALDNLDYLAVDGTGVEEVLRALDAGGPPLTEARVYLAGPAGPVAALQERLLARGVPAGRLCADVVA